MRAREISIFVICLALAAPLIQLTEIYASGATGVSLDSIIVAISVSGIIGILLGGGVSVAGFSFRVPAVLTGFLTIYGFSATLLETMVLQVIQPFNIAIIFAGVFGVLFIVVGYYAALEIAGSAHGPMQ